MLLSAGRRIVFIQRRLLTNQQKFLPNRERIIYKTRGEAVRDFFKVSGFNLSWQLLLAVVIVEFGFPTPDIVYDIKRVISPDFDLYCRSGNLVDFQLDFENRLRAVKKEEVRSFEQSDNAKNPAAKKLEMSNEKNETSNGSKAKKNAPATNTVANVNDLAPVKPLGKPTEGEVKPLGAPIKTPQKTGTGVRRPKYAQNLKKIDFTEDPVMGDQFEAFGTPEKSLNDDSPAKAHNNNNNNNKKPRYYQNRRFYKKPAVRKELPIPEVLAIPDEVECQEYQVSDENIVCYNGQSHFLSSLFSSPISIDGHEYTSVEHYYQACKLFTLAGQDVAAQTKTAKTPFEVKKLAKRLLQNAVQSEKIDEWKRTEAFTVLKHATYQKFAQNQELKDKLLETGNKILVHSYGGDTHFAAGEDQKGVSEWVKKNEGTTIKVPRKATADDVKYFPLIGRGKNVLGFITMQVREDLLAISEEKE
ncbi:unnamed protein product [Caenorhabditis auriculariae]|uniref:NADAR domain-containing protein n=1 Tax=Caenorhabditis auriculariae TaxID=2777116 RepID=A0A8S1GZT2_9PELO|nr:unnamed protein product [Caenorhabditis auriculariae]